MRHLLARGQGPVLRRLADAPALLAFDFDGTLAPIVARPERAGLRPRTRELLRAVARLYPCLVLSGRARADLRQRLRSVEGLRLLGNHGAERSARGSGARGPVAGWARLLERRLAGLGVEVERKELSLALHYRGAPRKTAARRAILAAAGTLPGARLLPGKQVVDLLPAGSPGKGRALRRAAARLGCAQVLYVGDDRTDEDVFALRWSGLVAVRIGRRSGSRARYFLRRQPEIDRLLLALLRLRERAHLPPRPGALRARRGSPRARGR